MPACYTGELNKKHLCISWGAADLMSWDLLKEANLQTLSLLELSIYATEMHGPLVKLVFWLIMLPELPWWCDTHYLTFDGSHCLVFLIWQSQSFTVSFLRKNISWKSDHVVLSMNRKTKSTLSSPQQHQSPLLLTSYSVRIMHAPLTLDIAVCFLQALKQSATNSSLFPLLLFFPFH